MIKDSDIHDTAKIVEPVNIYGSNIESHCFIGPFVEIQCNTKIKKGARVSTHTFVCEGVEIGEDSFIGHGVMFINDKFDSDSIKEWSMKTTKIGKNVRVGSNATILPVNIGDNAVIGAGSVVTKDVPANAVAYGNPAKIK